MGDVIHKPGFVSPLSPLLAFTDAGNQIFQKHRLNSIALTSNPILGSTGLPVSPRGWSPGQAHSASSCGPFPLPRPLQLGFSAAPSQLPDRVFLPGRCFPPMLWICSKFLVSYWILSFKSFSYASSLFSLREILSSACLTLSVKSVKFICVCPVVIFIERTSETICREEVLEARGVPQLCYWFSWHHHHPEWLLPSIGGWPQGCSSFWVLNLYRNRFDFQDLTLCAFFVGGIFRGYPWRARFNDFWCRVLMSSFLPSEEGKGPRMNSPTQIWSFPPLPSPSSLGSYFTLYHWQVSGTFPLWLDSSSLFPF